MIALSSLRTASLVIAGSAKLNAAADSLIGAGQPKPTETAKTEDIWSANHIDVNRMKIDLMTRVGEAFGLKVEDFADFGAMANVIEGKLLFMKPDIIKGIEHDLGLDELGLTLSDVLKAMKDPDGGADERLEAALAKELEENTPGPQRFEDIGIYRP